ncbi:MAG TPA: AI-2E family transporter [Longilinea sp.]|nr:AI-2E family transporter [Longilinea sp.]
MSNAGPDIESQTKAGSPRWSGTTKITVSLALLALSAWLLMRFHQIIGPLLIAFILAYLIYPLADLISRGLRAPWRLSVTVLYLIIIILFLGLITLGGLALVDQVQSLIIFVQRQITNLPKLIDDLTHNVILIGPFSFNLSQIDMTTIGNKLLDMVQPTLSKLGGVVGAIAGGAATTIGYVFFALLVSYFVVADTGGVNASLIRMSIPGYGEDTKVFGRELNRIWKAFLRNQMIIFLITVVVYNIVLGAWGVNFSFGLALLAGLARFVPYVGPFIAWTTYGLVCLFQGTTLFGLQPFPYALMVVGTAWLVDIIMDNFVVPRLMADALDIHPAAVMIFALIAANLFGLVGLLLAAPVLATVMLFSNYAIRKLFDLDPWEGLKSRPHTPNPPIIPFIKKLDLFRQRILRKKA